MKNVKRKMFVGIIIAMSSIVGVLNGKVADVYAVQAEIKSVDYHQPSGEEFSGTLVGDEQFNYVVTSTGEIIEKGSDDFWYYVTVQKNSRSQAVEFVKTDKKVAIDPKPATATKELDLPNNPELVQTPAMEPAVLSERSTRSGVQQHNLLVILVEFNDIKLTTMESEWQKTVFAEQEKSLKNYYLSETKGRINIVPATENYAIKDGIVKVKLDRNHPNTGGAINTQNQLITKEAMRAADQYVDYSQYDYNKNGQIEADELHVMTIIAGEEASADVDQTAKASVWGHRWALNSNDTVLDGKILNPYTQFGELHAKKVQDKKELIPATIGIIAHEFGHDIGLPDLYNTGANAKGSGLSYTSLMASGSWASLPGEDAGTTPVGLDAYSRQKLGMPVETIDPTKSFSNKTVQSIVKGDPTIIKIPTEQAKEYFLLENRELKGYDAGMARGSAIYSGGIAIYRVNENFSKNITAGQQLVKVVEANEGILGKSFYDNGGTFGADPFFYIGVGKSGVNQLAQLSKTTKPSTELSDGTLSDFSLEVNSAAGTEMTINFTGKRVPIQGITVTPQTADVIIDTTKQLTATITPIDATNKAINWSSSNNQVATVSSTGLVKGVKEGTVTITATTDDGKKAASTTITVKSKTIIEEYPTLVLGESLSGTFTANNKSHNYQFIAPEAGYYEFVVNDNYAKVYDVNWNLVRSEGIGGGKSIVFKEMKKGEKVFVKAEFGYYAMTYSIVVNHGIYVQGVKISASKKDVLVGENLQLYSNTTPLNASNRTTTWTSSNEEVAKVTSGGTIRGVKPGTATINAITEDGNKTDSIVITVNP